ncbi:MAG: sulfatase-like hydrolase/transferase [Actinobacteria bacterium]|nr:sulfatase-like hydrolase/transferase [Actinomycetota bacterium]
MFRHAYCAAPICMPSRWSILTGLFPHTHGMYANGLNSSSNAVQLRPEHLTLGQRLQPLGYLSGYAGKWHLGTGGRRPGFADFTYRYFRNSLDEPSQSEVVRLAERAGVALDDKLGGIEPDPTTYDRQTQIWRALLPLAYHPASHGAARQSSVASAVLKAAVPVAPADACVASAPALPTAPAPVPSMAKRPVVPPG